MTMTNMRLSRPSSFQQAHRRPAKHLFNAALTLSILHCHAAIPFGNDIFPSEHDRIGHPRVHRSSASNNQRRRPRGWADVPSSFLRNTSIHGNESNDLFKIKGGASGAGEVIRAGASANSNEVTKQSASSSSPSNQQQQQPSAFEYIPITALDNYGQSTQLRHAMESANRFGTPVLACIFCHDNDEDNDDAVSNDDNNAVSNGDNPQCADNEQSAENKEEEEAVENAILVCSLQRPRLGVISTSPSNNKQTSSSPSVHPSIQGMVRIIATRDDDHNSHGVDSSLLPKHSLHTAIITTGLQSDAQFLVSQLQGHLSKYWFRYDTLPPSSSSSSSYLSSSSSSSPIAQMVRDVLLDCMGYDRAEEVNSGKVSGGIGSAAPSYDENDDEEDGDSNGGSAMRAGRPLGVCSFLLGLDSSPPSQSSQQRPFLAMVTANGATQQYVACAMGAGSTIGNEKLSSKWRRGMRYIEARDMMREIGREIAKEKGWLLEQHDHDDDNDSGGYYHEKRKDGGGGLTMVCETVTSRGIDVDFLPL
mmetsp:Transcript_46007/g.96608  ORF Transcript_46007/g.96608 Transcript_46007/m.96608 type:complete len:532 (-) Transcript_46007:58-1653(-)